MPELTITLKEFLALSPEEQDEKLLTLDEQSLEVIAIATATSK